MTDLEIDLIASLLRGPPGLRLGACVEESTPVSTSLPTSEAESESGELCEEEEMRLSGTDGLGSSSDDFSRNTPAPRGERVRQIDAVSCRRVRDHLYFEGVPWGRLLERPVPSSFWTTSVTHGDHGSAEGAYEGFTYTVDDHTA